MDAGWIGFLFREQNLIIRIGFPRKNKISKVSLKKKGRPKNDLQLGFIRKCFIGFALVFWHIFIS